MAYLHPDLRGREFNFDQVSMVTSKLSDVPRSDVELSSYATKKIKVYLPFIGAPMDTVTEAPMAIALGLVGGLGVIHYNFPTVDEQIEQLKKVKNYKAAFVKDPVCLRPDNNVGDVYKIHAERGFYSIPITEDGTPHSCLLGFVSHRDIRYEIKNPKKELKYVMTPRQDLIVATKGEIFTNGDIRSAIKAANAKIKKKKLDKLIIVDVHDMPFALVTDRDLKLHSEYPYASVDENKQLYGSIAIKGSWHDKQSRKEEQERIDKAINAGADCLVIDQGIVYSSQLDIARYIKDTYRRSGIEIGVGNVASKFVVRELVEKGRKNIDMIKCGIGPGGVCKTTQELKIGRNQPSAVYECAQEIMSLKKKYRNMPKLNADGGIKNAGDAALLLALGADTIMMGSLLAGFDESPGPIITKDGRRVKKLRGMGSIEAMQAGGRARYEIGPEKNIMIEEGKVDYVNAKGSVEPFINEFGESVRQCLSKLGFHNVEELQKGCRIYSYQER